MEVTLNIISGKWKPAIISGLFKGPQRPKDLFIQNPKITKRVLNQQLRQLENDGIITKTIYTDQMPLKVEYYLTSTGKSLLPVVKVLSNWGIKYHV